MLSFPRHSWPLFGMPTYPTKWIPILYVYRELSYILGKTLDARSAERFPPRYPTVKEVARADDNRDHHAGARHRRQPHHFQHRGCRDAAATPLRSAAAVGRSGEDQSRHRRAKWGLLSGVLRLAAAEPHSRAFGFLP